MDKVTESPQSYLDYFCSIFQTYTLLFPAQKEATGIGNTLTLLCCAIEAQLSKCGIWGCSSPFVLSLSTAGGSVDLNLLP